MLRPSFQIRAWLSEFCGDKRMLATVVAHMYAESVAHEVYNPAAFVLDMGHEDLDSVATREGWDERVTIDGPC